MAYRSSATDLSRTSERWDRDRLHYERERDRFDDDERYHGRGGPRRSPDRFRDHSVDARFERRYPPRPRDDDLIRERERERERERRVIYDDEPRYRRPSPPGSEIDHRVFIEKERVRESPPRRPTAIRRQSSLDTFDRRRYYDHEEYGPPARINREEYRPPHYVPIPLPRARALPPPRRYGERESFEEIQVSDPHQYGDDDFHAYPERVREKEVIRTRRRNRSRESRATSHHGSTVRGSSRSSSVTSASSSSSGGTTVTVKSEYPKKGKTRIPSRLVSKRALIDLNYPFVEEGHTIIVQKALGQENIDDLLKLSEEYKKSELEVVASRSVVGDYVEEREVVYAAPAPAPPPPPTVISAPPPPPPVAVAPVEVVNTTTVVRDISPARTTTSYSSAGPVVIDARPREVSDEIAVGPLALVHGDRHHSRDRSDLRSEIRHLERELARRDRHDRDIVRAERLPTGELVMYEEQIEEVIEPRRGVRIEKDKKGRMSISVPRKR